MCTYRSRRHSHGQIGRFQTADTVCLHTGEVHLKEGKVKKLTYHMKLREYSQLQPDGVVLCVAIHSLGRGVLWVYWMTVNGICGVISDRCLLMSYNAVSWQECDCSKE